MASFRSILSRDIREEQGASHMRTRSHGNACLGAHAKQWATGALGSSRKACALAVNDKVHVQRTPAIGRHGGLHRVVQTAAPVHSSRREDSRPL